MLSCEDGPRREYAFLIKFLINLFWIQEELIASIIIAEIVNIEPRQNDSVESSVFADR